MSSPTFSPAPRWATERTEGRDSFGAALGRVAGALGVELMPWQQMVAGVALEHEAGRLCYRNTVVNVPRQSGKSTLLLALVIWRMLASAGQRCVFSAQDGNSAREMLSDEWWPRIARSRLAGRFTLHRAAGREGIRCTNGSRLRLMSTRETAGHGRVVDLAVSDEAWSVPDGRLEMSLRPAMSTKANAQWWLASTAGTHLSMWWSDKLAAAKTAAAVMREGTCGFQWAADPEDDPTDPDTWRRCMPALGYTVDEATIAADMTSMPLAEFRRAYLNQPPEVVEEGWRWVSEDEWEAARDDS
jgi:phage terminase large subunit-like protein